jgi:hypothetical protein
VSIQQSNGGVHGVGCSCGSCGREFGSPVELADFCKKPMQTYQACPFCFTKVGEPEEPKLSETTSALTREESKLMEGGGDASSERDADNPQEVECAHYFGYLKKRPKKTAIPDDCLTCPQMIKCIM